MAHGLALDGGQQALLASKGQLQASLTHLLKQWAVLEPALLELQEQRMLAIANSECAVCLDDYSPEARTAITPSSCRHHNVIIPSLDYHQTNIRPSSH